MTAPVPPAVQPSRFRTGLAIVLISVAVVLTLAVFVFLKIRSLPVEAAREAREVVQGLQRVAEAFRTGTITTSFSSYATSVTGTRYLQVASLREVASFQRQDEAALLWGALPLPDVLVEARVGVEYTYFVDLDGTWKMTLDDNEILVLAPRLAHNRPAPDVSSLALTVTKGSVLRDENAVKAAMMQNLSTLLETRARANTSIVRDTARTATSGFLERWLADRFSDGRQHVVRVTFADEPAKPASTAPPPTIEGGADPGRVSPQSR